MRLPRHIASTPAQGTGIVRASDIGALTRTGGQEFEALQQAGGAIKGTSNLAFKAHQNRQAIDDIAESGKATQRVQESWNTIHETVSSMDLQVDQPLPNDPNYNKTMLSLSKDKIDKMLPDLLKDVEKDATKIFAGIRNPKTRASLVNQYNENYAGQVKEVKGTLSEKLNDYQLGEMNKLASDAALAGNMEASDFYIDAMDKHELITHTTALSLKAGNAKLHAKSSVNNTKPIIEQVLIENDFAMKPANEAIDMVVGQLQKEGILDDVSATEARKDLSNWAADVTSQRKAAVNEDRIQVSEGFADEILKGTFTGDDVELSNLTITEKKEWESIVKGVRLPPANAATHEGTNTVTDTLVDYANGKIGKLKALDNVTTAYSDKNITHSQYKLAINRIKTKYPDDVAKNIKGATDAARQTLHQQGFGILGIDRLDAGEKDQLSSVTFGLLNWIERESADGKYPTGEAIYKKTRELGVSVKTPESLLVAPPEPIPDANDPLYDPNDSDFEKLAPGTNWYDPTTRQWWTKNE